MQALAQASDTGQMLDRQHCMSADAGTMTAWHVQGTVQFAASAVMAQTVQVCSAISTLRRLHLIL